MPTRYAPGKFFDAHVAETMREAFEAAWLSLQNGGSVHAAPDATEAVREALALRIIETAQRGERDVDRLRDDALRHVADGNGLQK
jgi:hypothetical protein